MIVGRSHEAVVLKRLKSKKIVGVLFKEEKRGRDDWVAICQVFSDTVIPSNVVFLFSHY